jgi:hypothetical protein
VQSNYSLSFTTEPSPIPPATAILPNTNFQAAVTLAESGSAFTAASESIPLTLTGTGTLSNGTASTASGVASYSTLQVSAAGTGDKLTATLAVTGSASVSATSNGFNVATPATMTTPTAGSTLGTTDVSFTWSAGVGVTAYELVLGTTGFGSHDLYNSGLITTTTATVSSIPADLLTVYARLCSKISGVLSCNNYTYTEAGTATPATMTTPTGGSTLGTTNVQFTWGGGVGATAYELILGTKGFGSYDLYNSGLVTATNATVASLPANGVKVYARLCSEISGALSCNNYTYTEQ